MIRDKDFLMYDNGVVETIYGEYRFNNIGELISEAYDLFIISLYLKEI